MIYREIEKIIIATILTFVLVFIVNMFLIGCAFSPKREVTIDYLPSLCKLEFKTQRCIVDQDTGEQMSFTEMEVKERVINRKYFVIDGSDLKTVYQILLDRQDK